MSSKVKFAIGIAVFVQIAVSGQPSMPTLTYSQFLDQVRTGRISSVIVTAGNSGATPATCRLKNGDTVRTVLPSDYRDALVAMQDHQVDIEIRPSSGRLQLLLNATPFLLLLGVWFFLFRMAQSKARPPT